MLKSTITLDRLMKDVFGDTHWYSNNLTGLGEYHSERTADGYVLELPVPGLTKDDLNVKIRDGKLYISGGKEDQRWCPKFERAFTLPSDVNTKNVNAKVTNGILVITLALDKDAETFVKIS